jgi:(2R)-ethylmalonyl-CoA mutase
MVGRSRGRGRPDRPAEAWRAERDAAAVTAALAALRARRGAGENIMPASIAAAKAGVTTGEWAA